MRNYLKTIEELSKSPNLHNGEIINFAKEILANSSRTLGCSRCNAWLFENNQDKLVSLLSYNKVNNLFTNEDTLSKEQVPNYFKYLKKNEFIVSDNARIEPINSELLESYIIPNEITSMIDVPLRSDGKMIGVICFEHVKTPHQWSNDEKKFTQSVAQLLSLALETKKKREYRVKLEKIIKQKEVLISEINHRVKNNMAIIISLMNLQQSKMKDTYHSELLEDIKGKVFSMSMIQEQLHSNENVDSISLRKYLEDLVRKLNTSYSKEGSVEIVFDMEEIIIDVSKAIPCGLIANEILTNSFKYAFNDENEFPKLVISLKKRGDSAELIFHDNGPGFDLDSSKKGMGLELIKDLSDQIDASTTFNVQKGVSIKLLFPIS
jgi:two-component sensor histidine kinase